MSDRRGRRTTRSSVAIGVTRSCQPWHSDTVESAKPSPCDVPDEQMITWHSSPMLLMGLPSDTVEEDDDDDDGVDEVTI